MYPLLISKKGDARIKRDERSGFKVTEVVIGLAKRECQSKFFPTKNMKRRSRYGQNSRTNAIRANWSS